jgi:hypothetical protein
MTIAPDDPARPDVYALLDEHLRLNLPLFDVPLSRFIMRPSIAVPRPSVSQTASD